MSERPLATVCAWCERVRHRSGEWRRDEQVVPPSATTTHGICPDCLEQATNRATITGMWTGER